MLREVCATHATLSAHIRLSCTRCRLGLRHWARGAQSVQVVDRRQVGVGERAEANGGVPHEAGCVSACANRRRRSRPEGRTEGGRLVGGP